MEWSNNKQFKYFKLLLILFISIICISIVLSINFNYLPNAVSSIISEKVKLNIYKFWYLKYKRIFKNKLESRFNNKDLQLAIANAKSQFWVQEQIEADLKPFSEHGLSVKAIEQLYERLVQVPRLKHHLIKVQIKNHKLRVDYAYEAISRLRSYKTIYNVINTLNEYRLIPDCTFIIYLNDYWDYIPDDIKDPVPIFNFAKDTEIPIEKNVILIPDWMNVYYWDVLRGRIDIANKIYPWSKKEPLIHWRGGRADSAQHRQKLVDLRSKLTFLDVGMTEGSNKVPFIHPEFSLKYKYQVALDGARCTWERVVWQMYSNCLMIKPKSSQIQWFYRGLKVNYNYLYLEDINEQDLTEAYKWLIQHDDKVQQIIKNANDFAKNNFKIQDFFAYYVVLLQEYAKLMRD